MMESDIFAFVLIFLCLTKIVKEFTFNVRIFSNVQCFFLSFPSH